VSEEAMIRKLSTVGLSQEPRANARSSANTDC
jgi:hypothetical protein